MDKLNLGKLKESLEARTFQEKLVLVAVFLFVLGYAWLLMGYDRLNVRQQELERQIATVNTQIAQQKRSYEEIENSFSEDPNAFARSRLGVLRTQTMAVDSRLNELYGQLILPREMSLVLTSILQKETTLNLIGLENVPPESLFQANVNAQLIGQPALLSSTNQGQGGLRVFKHGLIMNFEGTFLETIRYLQSLEELDSNFFWEELVFDLGTYPNARITMRIFTLSTQQGWIGV